jgi:hypothetical protein
MCSACQVKSVPALKNHYQLNTFDYKQIRISIFRHKKGVFGLPPNTLKNKKRQKNPLYFRSSFALIVSISTISVFRQSYSYHLSNFFFVFLRSLISFCLLTTARNPLALPFQNINTMRQKIFRASKAF